MRTFLTSFMAFCLSLLAGSLVAQGLAVTTHAGQEFILVFMAVPLVTILVTVLFLIPQFFALRRRAVDKTGKWSLALFALLSVALLVFDFVQAQADLAMVRRDMPILVGLMLTSLAIILIHWLFVRWRVAPSSASMGVQPA